MLFENAFSHASDTRLSMAALLSGFLPHETAVMKRGAPSPEEDLLPNVLQRYGYTTLAVVSNYVLRASRGWSVGFDVFDDQMDEREAVRSLPERTAPGTTERAVELLREHRDERFFLMVPTRRPPLMTSSGTPTSRAGTSRKVDPSAAAAASRATRRSATTPTGPATSPATTARSTTRTSTWVACSPSFGASASTADL